MGVGRCGAVWGRAPAWDELMRVAVQGFGQCRLLWGVHLGSGICPSFFAPATTSRLLRLCPHQQPTPLTLRLQSLTKLGITDDHIQDIIKEVCGVRACLYVNEDTSGLSAGILARNAY